MPIIDKDTKVRVEYSPENGTPYFYAGHDLIIELFKCFRIVKVFQTKTTF